MTAQVTGLYIYPLKSAQAVELEHTDITADGPSGDRRYMLVYADGPNQGRFISQRERGCEKLAAVSALPTADDILKISAPDMQDLTVESSASAQTLPVRVWSDDCSGIDQGEAAAKWFSDYTGINCRLVRMSPASPRLVDQTYAGPQDIVFYADGFPIWLPTRPRLRH